MAVALGGGGRRVGEMAVEFDDQTLLGPEGVDDETLDRGVHFRLRDSRGLAELEEPFLEHAEREGEARVVRREGAAKGGTAGMAALDDRGDRGWVQET